MKHKQKLIDKDQFEKLCGLQCTLIEISGWFTVSDDTIERWCKKTYQQSFAAVFRQKRQTGCVSLRRKQMEMATSGNITMLIFLGKQYLGQSDKIDQTISNNSSDTIAAKLKAISTEALLQLVKDHDKTKES